MKKRNMVPLLVALCLVGTLVLSIGVAQARFRENWTETLPFRPEGEENLVLRQDGNWVEEENVQELTFSLENTNSEEAAAGELYVLASEGIENPDKLEIVLTAQGVRYTAQAQPIVPGSVLHRSFGDGWVYRFLDDQGQEKTWDLKPAQQQTFVLSVETDEEIEYHSLLRLIAKKTQTA